MKKACKLNANDQEKKPSMSFNESSTLEQDASLGGLQMDGLAGQMLRTGWTVSLLPSVCLRRLLAGHLLETPVLTGIHLQQYIAGVESCEVWLAVRVA
jgi:hypothetical protein